METFPNCEHDPPHIPKVDNRGAPPNRGGAELNRLASPRKISWAEPPYTSRECTEPNSGDSVEMGSSETDIDGLVRKPERTNPFEDPTTQSGEFTAQAMADRFATEEPQVRYSSVSLATPLTLWQKKSNLKPTHRRTNSEPTPTDDRRAGASPTTLNFANQFADPSTTNGRMSGRFSPQLIQVY